MPARSNDFQRLILHIETQLAPAGATVEESAMVKDTHDGSEREVDVMIRYRVGNRELTMGIECRDHKRRADKAWIEQIKAKYDILPIDRRVAVSRRGFSKAALTLAKLWHIETLTLSAAQKLLWAHDLQQHEVKILESTLTVEGFTFLTPVPHPPERLRGLSPDGLAIRESNGRVRPFATFVRWALGPEAFRAHKEFTRNAADSRVTLRVTVPRGTALLHDGATAFEIAAVDLHCYTHRTLHEPVFEAQSYGSATVATAVIQGDDQPLTVVLSDGPEGVDASITFHETDKWPATRLSKASPTAQSESFPPTRKPSRSKPTRP